MEVMTHTRTVNQSIYHSSTAEESPILKHLSSKAQEDYVLINQAIDGNQRAYTQLTQRYWHSIFQKMLQMVKNREDAHDLTQEAFFKAFHKLPTYAPNFAFSTWLFKIAKNNCIDHIRKKRVPTYSIDDPIVVDNINNYSNNRKTEELDPSEKMIRNEKIDMVHEMVNGLNKKYKSMIQLRFYEDKSYDEIAQLLDLPLGTVKAQLFRAKELLFEQMQEAGPSAYLETTKRWKKRKPASQKAAPAPRGNRQSDDEAAIPKMSKPNQKVQKILTPALEMV